MGGFDGGGDRGGGGRLGVKGRGGRVMCKIERGGDACFILINRQYECVRTDLLEEKSIGNRLDT